MDKRTFRKLPEDEQRRALRDAAAAVNSALSLSGRETIEELIDAASDENTAAAYVRDILTVGPDFPQWFVSAAKPACNTYLRYAYYWRGE